MARKSSKDEAMAIVAGFEEKNVKKMDEAECRRYLICLRAVRDALEELEPKVSEPEEYNDWLDDCEYLEDLIDDVSDRLESL